MSIALSKLTNLIAKAFFEANGSTASEAAFVVSDARVTLRCLFELQKDRDEEVALEVDAKSLSTMPTELISVIELHYRPNDSGQE